MPLDMVLKMLEEEFELMANTFETENWKFYKFGRGGPYFRTLTHLQEKSKKHDHKIFKFFGLQEETASFTKLITLSLHATKNPKERFKNIDTFRRQIKRMRKII